MFSCTSTNEPKLTIAVAANAKETLSEIAKEFSLETGIKTVIVSGSSGKLTAQIENNAPFDLFFSANMKYPNYLFEKKLSSKPILYAKGSLVVCTMNKNLQNLSIDSLLKYSRKIAIANAKNAPYGIAALEFLNTLDSSLYIGKLITSENISQTNQFILEQAVNIGFTSKSSMENKKMKKSYWIEIDNKLHSPINQGFIITLYGKRKHLEESEKLKKFIASSTAKEILLKYGYIVNE